MFLSAVIMMCVPECCHYGVCYRVLSLWCVFLRVVIMGCVPECCNYGVFLSVIIMVCIPECCHYGIVCVPENCHYCVCSWVLSLWCVPECCHNGVCSWVLLLWCVFLSVFIMMCVPECCHYGVCSWVLLLWCVFLSVVIMMCVPECCHYGVWMLSLLSSLMHSSNICFPKVPQKIFCGLHATLIEQKNLYIWIKKNKNKNVKKSISHICKQSKWPYMKYNVHHTGPAITIGNTHIGCMYVICVCLFRPSPGQNQSLHFIFINS